MYHLRKAITRSFFLRRLLVTPYSLHHTPALRCRAVALCAGWCASGPLVTSLFAAEPLAKGIQDNSFLIEEAYNQEPGVVQHIFNAQYTTSGRLHGWNFSFTQEWPVFSLDHQLSYTIPSFHLIDDKDRVYGGGDILINYRYQALEEGETKPAFAPRFSLISV